MSDLENLQQAIASGNRDEAKRLTQALIDASTPPGSILDGGLVPGMSIIGEKFKCNEAFVPEMLLAARAMKEALSLLEPLLVAEGIEPEHTAVIGTVQGDLHDIGKNLVGMMLKGANIGVVDLGANVSPQAFVAAAKEHRASIIGLSALLTTTMPAMEQTVQAVRAAELEGTRVIIGGAPITQEYANRIGADGYAPDAASAVDVVQALLS